MKEVFKILSSVKEMCLATVDEKCCPYSTPVYFVSNNESKPILFFFSSLKSKHSKHILQNSTVSASIYPKCSSWTNIRGLQLMGTAYPIDIKEDWEIAWQLYVEKFPFVKSLKLIVKKQSFFSFTPNWIRLIDNRQMFGFKNEWNF